MRDARRQRRQEAVGSGELVGGSRNEGELQRDRRRGSVDIFFFFSSRRRHTRFDCDWSSDVCSSDLEFNSLTNWVYVLESSSDFKAWAAVSPAENGIGTLLHLIDTNKPSAKSFYRVRRSEEHTSELQSQSNLVCRLLLENKKNAQIDR